jgi:HD superfamily phosphodiesterase
VSNAELVDWARSTARNLLADSLPRRWKHVQGVAATANRIRKAVGADGEVLVASAWLHDIGYSP